MFLEQPTPIVRLLLVQDRGMVDLLHVIALPLLMTMQNQHPIPPEPPLLVLVALGLRVHVMQNQIPAITSIVITRQMIPQVILPPSQVQEKRRRKSMLTTFPGAVRLFSRTKRDCIPERPAWLATSPVSATGERERESGAMT